MSLTQDTQNSRFDRKCEQIEDLPVDLIGRILKFLWVNDCLQVESSSKWGREHVNRHFATFGDETTKSAETLGGDYTHCVGCCQCADVFDGSPASMLCMRFFVWIGSSESHDCYWKGPVLHTSTEILLDHEIQDALLGKSPAFQELYQLLTKESNQQNVLDKATTPNLDEMVTRVQRLLSFRVIAVYPCQALVMAATPVSRHLQIHWDDTSYNPFYQNKPDAYWDAMILASNDDSSRSKKAACMHVWFRLHANKPAELAFIRVDRCTGSG